MSRKWPAIDLLDLSSKSDHKNWNALLKRAFQKNDILWLTKTRYGLQAGMADLVGKKLNTPKMIEFFIRLQRSLENTVRDIQRKQEPNPCDNPLLAGKNLEFHAEKKQRDHSLELFFKKSSY